MTFANQLWSLSAVLGLLLAAFHWSPTCSAQPHSVDGKRLYDHISNPSLNVEKKASGGLRIKNGTETHFRHMDKPPSELPGLALPGERDGKYAFGLQRPQHGATVLYLQYKMKQPKEYVMAQFREMMKGAGWALGRQSNPDQLMATARGNACTIQVMKYGGTYPTSLAIFYTMKDR
jgi:hypothetical protein